ncbi:uncharacterized protein ACLA_068800 [Aspergillus clavatus NRRL 1]|uniref:RRM domain-containing protein n=1 Tax=Aspergillus clavatus (strain ATCC 1007 / CBS 513.65 / DSM 816 / NCTC 3887 / NRRL 1 / QM 1276 / 107) TaxID=344612 RepID=A1C631_ASPCL|nr:uncharacterized protein ACLA_068800 [Aspergillus clavatus NRRL 1]EAW13852.1 conserved hypothetical protein [Aspergillus clavatus NRRL 1]
MAASQGAVSFDAIIQADRKKRKNEELASKILGKSRKTAAGSGAGNKPQKATPGSLASRIGVTKKPAAANVPKPTKKNNRTPSAPARPVPTQPKRVNKRRPDEDRLLSALNPASGQATVRDNQVGMTIRGAGSGPFVVVGSNFAPGTTAADIQSALEPVSGPIMSCWITSQHPTVTAEITLAEKWSAENVIANFHNQRADGRIISMRMKQSTIGSAPFASAQKPQSSFDDLREQAERERHMNRRADPIVQDGNYGFGEKANQGLGRDESAGSGRYNRRNARGNRTHGRGGRQANQNTQETGLYSDQMMVDGSTQKSGNRSGRHW